MSYSFRVQAATKFDVKALIDAEFDKVVASQAVHAKDRDAAQAAAEAFVDVLDDDEEKDVSVSVAGSLAGNWAGSELTSISGADVSIRANLTTKA